ncbi:MAG: bifunctional riboflavin kinase/FAD synthetase [Methylophilaceae bacterium]|nr:bifunctional riboflavin kinase/FAD synthetase [Methylophilaceae bacterium]
MLVFRHLPIHACPPIALAIGNFDGVHLGHQALLDDLVTVAKQQGLISAVLTFEPHPREFFSPSDAPARLTTLREKLELFDAAGVEKVFVCPFNKHFAKISAQDFMHNILMESLNVKSILVGDDFRFGAKRTGTLEDITAAGFDLINQPQINLAGQRVSSTRVREALADGDLTLAKSLLGRAYSISGKVVHGAKRGRQLGFPTANIHMRHERPALNGVYAVKLCHAQFEGEQLDGLPSVANLGVRPTIAGIPKLLLEVHALDFAGYLYGQHVHVQFLHKLRDEMKFDGLDALKAQISRDVEQANIYFG